jgi:DNA repair photolyase
MNDARKRIWRRAPAAAFFTTPLTITSQFGFCGLPLRLDSYAGCGFRCTFCFARFRGGNSFGESVRPAPTMTLAHIFRRALETDDDQKGFVAQFLRRRVPVHFGGMSDPFQPAETRHGITKSFLHTLARYHYPTVISTRSTMVASHPYVDLLQEIGPVVVQFSFCSTKNTLASRFEPYSAVPTGLLKTMERLTKKGITVSCRWQPYIPGASEPAEEFVSRVSGTGCRHVALEHLKVPVERNHPLWERLTQAAGRDLHDEYKTLKARPDGREFVLPASAKLPTIIDTATAVRRRKMSFGAADNEFQYVSDTGCCCSGVDQFPGFGNWFKHQIGYAVRSSVGGRITYDSLSREWTPAGSIDRFLNSHSRLSSRNGMSGSIRDHLKMRWNNPKSPASPTSFYGVIPAGEVTSSGNKVYKWDEEMLKPLLEAGVVKATRTAGSALMDAETS